MPPGSDGALLPPPGTMDWAALWGHLPGAGSADALAAFPLTPAPSQAHPALYGLAPVRASQQ